jgi:beta-glucosidase
VFVGYRYWDQHAQAPLFPFGHGLSYGSATMTGQGVTMNTDGSATVRVTLENRGKRATTQVPQLYLGFPAEAGQPPRQLKGFAKVTLQPGERRDVEISLPRAAFRSWDEDRSRWRTLAGDYPLSLGRSSRDIVWQGKIVVTGD